MSNGTMFLIFCGALVLFMTPGLAFFYGGLVRASSVVSMMMMSFGSIGLLEFSGSFMVTLFPSQI